MSVFIAVAGERHQFAANEKGNAHWWSVCGRRFPWNVRRIQWIQPKVCENCQ